MLARRIRDFQERSLAGQDVDFGALALDLHRWQAACDPVLAAQIEIPPQRWEDIPAIPVALFRDLPVGTVRRDEPSVAFRTSGTTAGTRGVHRVRSTALYDLGAVAWMRRQVPEAPGEIVAALSDPAVAVDSSLSHMVGLFGSASWHLRDGVLDGDSLEERLRTVGRSVFAATTAFALEDWLRAKTQPLPEGSVLMVTGGFKGRAHELDDDALYAEARRQLRPARVVTEYGMTELSSQLWGTPETPYQPPPWLRVLAIDPATGHVLPAGRRGQLRFFDLANLDGTVAVETMDEGVVGEHGEVTLLGRLAGAPPRGCSLTVEEAWAKKANL